MIYIVVKMPDNEDIEELKKELKKLRPDLRIKRLKELEGKRKSEITQIEDLIKDSEKDLKTEKVAEAIVPRQIEVDIRRLFEEDGNRLEATARREAPQAGKSSSRGYTPFKQIYNDYTQLQGIAYASMMGTITQAQREAVDKIGERLDRTKYEPSSREVANVLVASRAVLYKIRKYAGIEGTGNV